MTKWALLCAAALAPVATSAAAPDATGTTATAQKIIQARMLDPSSLVIRNTRTKTATSANGKAVTLLCGEYNAKNRFGGYTGFKQFVFEASVMKGVLSFEDDLALDFFSATGAGDLSHNPEPAIKAGADPAVLTAANRKYTEFAIKYLPACLGAS